MKRFFGSLNTMIRNMFNTTSSTTLKECYQPLLLFVVMNFILLVFWAMNPFQWEGLASVIFDVVMIIYGLLMVIMMTSTLIRRFIDASIHPYQAIIFSIAMLALFILIRLRSFSEVMILVILSIYFLSHFYLMMLVMMPTARTDDEMMQDK